MPFKFLRFRLLAICRSYFVAGVCAAFACLLGGLAIAAPGQLDPTFGVGGKLRLQDPIVISYGIDSQTQAGVTLADGRIVLAGTCPTFAVASALCVWRFMPDGSADMTFGGVGRLVDLPIRSVIGLHVEPDATTQVATHCSSIEVCIHRFAADGTPQSNFGTNGVARTSFSAYDASSLKMSSWRAAMGEIFVGATCSYVAAPTTACVLKLNPDGTRDTTFATAGQLDMAKGPSDSLETVALLADGTFVTGGICWDGVAHRFCYSRFGSSGQVLAGESGPVIVAGGVSARGLIQILPLNTGGSLLAGTCNVPYVGQQFCALALTDSFALDVSFGQSGSVTVAVGDDDTVAMSVTAVATGGLVLTGRCGLMSGNSFVPSFCTVAIDASGALMTSFALNGRSIVDVGPGSDVSTVSMFDTNGKLVLAGDCSGPGTARNLCMIRLKGGPYNPLSCALNADANQAIEPATDAIVLTRYLLGLRGDALTTGALGLNPTRTGQALETYLASLDLDVDGDGQALATTDGLLLIRALLGLTGDALTAGATNATHPNVRNAQQILSWIESTHGVACLP